MILDIFVKGLIKENVLSHKLTFHSFTSPNNWALGTHASYTGIFIMHKLLSDIVNLNPVFKSLVNVNQVLQSYQIYQKGVSVNTINLHQILKGN